MKFKKEKKVKKSGQYISFSQEICKNEKIYEIFSNLASYAN